MKRIYITAVPLASNFLLEKWDMVAVNCHFDFVPSGAFCIPAVMRQTMQEGDEAKVVVVRQVNETKNGNYDMLIDELNATGIDYTLQEISVQEAHDKDILLSLFTRMLDVLEDNACYYACMTNGAKSYPVILFSILSYVDKILEGTEVKGIYYREMTRGDGVGKAVRLYDVTSLFTLNRIVDLVAEMDTPNAKELILSLLQ